MANLYECVMIGQGGGSSEVYINDEQLKSSLSLITQTRESAINLLGDAVKDIYLANGGINAELSFNDVKSALNTRYASLHNISKDKTYYQTLYEDIL